MFQGRCERLARKRRFEVFSGARIDQFVAGAPALFRKLRSSRATDDLVFRKAKCQLAAGIGGDTRTSRHLIEGLFGKFKKYWGIAPLCRKAGTSDGAFIAIAVSVIRVERTSASHTTKAGIAGMALLAGEVSTC